MKVLHLINFCLTISMAWSEFVTDENSIYPNVITPIGKFIGNSKLTRRGKIFYEFRGIPYAKPPERFQESKPTDYLGEYNATFDRSICAQLLRTAPDVKGSEDCLYMMVMFPDPERCGGRMMKDDERSYEIPETGTTTPKDSLLPVMFFLHHGGFKRGSGSVFTGEYVLDHCMVLVNINYRLGTFGFSTTGDNVMPGNLGIKDQVLALKWVQKYIKYFRGDPKRVTIYGVSSGAASVSLHLLSPSTKGLFHAAISSSGVFLNPWVINHNPLLYTTQLAAKLNCSVASSTTIKACLLTKKFEDIIAAQETLSISDIVFTPVVEPANAVNPYLTKSPYELLIQGDFHRVPFMCGFLEEDGVYYGAQAFTSPEAVTYISNTFNTTTPIQFKYDQLNIPQPELNLISQKIKDYYFNYKNVTFNDRKAFMDMVSDRLFFQGTYELAKRMANFTPTYLYFNTYVGGVSAAQVLFGYKRPAIVHTDDEQFLYTVYTNFTVGTEQYQFSKDFVEIWVNFAKHGVPFGRLTKSLTWDRVIGEPYKKVYTLDVTSRYTRNLFENRTKFWRNLGLYKYEFK